MALRDYGLKSERVLWQGKGPGVFETELGDLGLEGPRPLLRPEQTLRLQPVLAEALVYCHSSAPLRQM